MKNLGKTLIVAGILLAFSLNAKSQVSATANATAEIVAPIAIAVNTNLDFGRIIRSAAPGTVDIATDGTPTYNGGVAAGAGGATITAATFDVSGTAGYTYAITAPLAADVITLTDGTNTMTVTSFVRDPAGDGTLDGSGNETINIGGTLSVAAGQATGTYTNTTDLTVTVNYN